MVNLQSYSDKTIKGKMTEIKVNENMNVLGKSLLLMIL